MRGHKLDDLLNADVFEKTFYMECEQRYWQEQAEFYTALFCGKEK